MKTITGMDLIIDVFLYIIFSKVLLQECATEQGKKLTSWFTTHGFSAALNLRKGKISSDESPKCTVATRG